MSNRIASVLKHTVPVKNLTDDVNNQKHMKDPNWLLVAVKERGTIYRCVCVWNVSIVQSVTNLYSNTFEEGKNFPLLQVVQEPTANSVLEYLKPFKN